LRLAPRIFLASALVIVVLVAVAVASLLAVSQLVRANRAIVTRAVPAFRAETAAREALGHVVRLEQRMRLLRDARYDAAWSARADRLGEDVARLGTLLATPAERHWHQKAERALARYRALVEGARHDAGRAADTEAAVGRTQRALDLLAGATWTAMEDSRRRADALEARVRTALLIGVPTTLLLALLAAAGVALGMTRALRRLAAATTEVGAGSFTPRFEVDRNDEIGELARCFERMVGRLGELERTKEEFFAHISHELRSPLTAIREAAHLLRDRVPGPLEPKQARLVEIIDASGERMLGLVNRILDLARLRAGLLALDKRPVNLGSLVTRALEEVRPQAEARGLAVERHGPAAGPRVTGDEERLLEVLVNLLGNAVKYTPPGGRVRVDVGERPQRVEVVVEDTGPGIPPEALAHVFDRYWQAPGSRPGSGLGLAIVKSIVEAHGGHVEAASVEGRGSRFTVRLPRESRAA
jgi:signal transduction histidine kinase